MPLMYMKGVSHNFNISQVYKMYAFKEHLPPPFLKVYIKDVDSQTCFESIMLLKGRFLLILID